MRSCSVGTTGRLWIKTKIGSPSPSVLDTERRRQQYHQILGVLTSPLYGSSFNLTPNWRKDCRNGFSDACAEGGIIVCIGPVVPRLFLVKG